MGQYGVKLTDEGRDYFLHYDSDLGRPVFVAVSLADYRRYIGDRFGAAMDAFGADSGRWDRLQDDGIDTLAFDSPEAALAGNVAGPGGRLLTVEGIKRKFLRGRTRSENV